MPKWGLEIAEKPVLWIHDPSSNADELEITIKAFAEGEEEPSGTLDVNWNHSKGLQVFIMVISKYRLSPQNQEIT